MNELGEITDKIVQLLQYDPVSPLIFSSGLFLFLFAGFMLIYNAFRRAPMARIVYVILFSLYFYYKSSGIYFLLLIFAATSDFLIAQGIYRVRSRAAKRWLVVLSVMVNLGMLGYFKYTNFLVVIANHGYSDLIMDAARGAGAAGGTGGGMLGLFNATMRPGIELVLDLLHAREACAWADVVITGEGSIDGQTPYGKVPSGIARLAKSQGKPVIAIGGKVTRDPNVTAALNEAGIVATFGIAPGPAALPELLTGTKRNVEATCAAIASLLSVARECSSRPHQ